MKKLISIIVLAMFASAGALIAEDDEYTSNTRGLDRGNMDTSVSPCQDFYRYANGKWLDRNEIPADQSSWGISSEMRERTSENPETSGVSRWTPRRSNGMD